MEREPPLQVEAFLEGSAVRLPDKTAIVCGDVRMTYARLNAEADRLGRVLRDHAVRRGDRVVIQLDNSIEAVVAIFATLKAGAVFVVVNPSVKPDKLAYLLNNSRASAIVSDRRKLGAARGPLAATPHLRVVIGVDGEPAQLPDDGKTFVPFSAAANGGTRIDRGGIDVDLAALIYTSGSTGQPKGVMLTHLNIVSAATSITTYLENTEADVLLDALPLSFDYGLYQVLMAFKFGGTVVLERSFAYPHAVLQTLVRERVTGFPIVPTMSAILLQMDLARYDLRSLRYITNTAAALPTQHVRELRRAFPRVAIYSMYGLTECKRVSYLPPDEIDARPGSVGRGMPNEEVYLVDDEGRRLAAGEGELVIRGSNVMKGYWEMPDESDRVLRPGPLPGERVLYSGDIFRMDEAGYLYFIGRKDDIIKTRGEKVAPREVENVLCDLPGVAEAAVIGVPDPILGESIAAFVTLRPGATLLKADILRHCATRLEDFMVPKSVEFVPAMPRSDNGKIAKARLKDGLLAGPQ